MSGIPTPTEDELLSTFEEIQRTGVAHCRICDAAIDVSDAESWGDVFDALFTHGEERDDHVWDDIDGWVLTEADDE